MISEISENRVLKRIALTFSVSLLIMAGLFMIWAVSADNQIYPFAFIGEGGTFNYDSFRIGSRWIYFYNLCEFIGLFIMIGFSWPRKERYGYSDTFSVITPFFLSVFGYTGAKILYILENFSWVKHHGIHLGGVSFFGAVFIYPLITSIIAVCTGKKLKECLNYCVVSGALMFACIRIGCFLNSCCQGITFYCGNNPCTVPVQLIESSLDFFLLWIMLTLEERNRQINLYFIFMGGYGIIRFILEFLRETDKNTFGMSHGQIFSIICILIFVVYIYRYIHQSPDRKNK